MTHTNATHTKQKLYQLTNYKVCAGVITNAQNIIVDCAPYLKWAIGKNVFSLRPQFKIYFIEFIPKNST